MANTPQDDRFYKSGTLLKWFAISSVIMMVFTIWMVLDDFGREWKGFQREFFAIQEKKLDDQLAKAKSGLDENKLKELQSELAKANETIKGHHAQLAKLQDELTSLKTKEKIATARYQGEKAVWDVRKYEYENVYGHKIAQGHEGLDPKADAALTKLEKHWDHVLELRNTMNEATQSVTAKQGEIDNLLAARTTVEKAIKKMEADVDRLVAAKEKSELTLSKLLRSAPIVDMANPTFRLQQIVLPEITDDIYFSQVPKVDRCTTCHLAIDKAGFEDQPNPFKTHPKLDLILGSRSPHPIDKIGCTVCHDGRGTATHFVRSAHTPRNEEQEKEWKKKYHWSEQHYVNEKMIPLQYVEGKCRVCHKQQEYIGGAEKLNASVQLIRGAGCYGCHRIEGWDHIRKPAPGLENIKGKLTRDFIYKWIKDPQSFNKYARMPSFFLQSNITTDEYRGYQEAEMQAITDYILDLSGDYKPDVHIAPGNAEHGKELFGSVGCLACHQIDDFPRTRGRFGIAPDLTTVGSKVSPDWLASWLRNPRHFWSGTTMPSLRLSDTEIADLSAFLLAHKNPEFDSEKVPQPSIEKQKAVLKLYLMRDPKLAPVTEEKVNKVLADLTPHEVTMKLGSNAVGRYGCYGCHEIKGLEKTPGIGTELTEEGSKPLNKFDFGLKHIEPYTNYGWFHAKLTDTRQFDEGAVKEYLDLLRMPNFHFTEEERQSLILALEGMTSQKISPPAAKLMSARDTQIEEGLRVIHKYNCQGCHVLEGLYRPLADDDPNQAEHEKDKYNLEGRILKYYSDDESLGPPVILTEGKRLYTNWAYKFLENPGNFPMRVRLKVRMPTFQMSPDEINKIVTYWARWGDVEFPIAENPPVHLTPQQLADGKALVAKLQCFNCHSFGEKLTQAEMEGGSKGIAPNLQFAAKKIRKEWIVQLLKDPNKMIPGTRMPGFWPDGQSPAPEILGGNSEAQQNLIADYIIYMGQQHPPAEGPVRVTEKEARVRKALLSVHGLPASTAKPEASAAPMTMKGKTASR